MMPSRYLQSNRRLFYFSESAQPCTLNLILTLDLSVLWMVGLCYNRLPLRNQTWVKKNLSFFANSLHIMLVLSKAAQLCIYFCEGKSVVLHLLEDQIKDALLGDRKRRKKPSTRTHDLKSLAPQACTLPLCYKRCPSFSWPWIKNDLIFLMSLKFETGTDLKNERMWKKLRI